VGGPLLAGVVGKDINFFVQDAHQTGLQKDY
jgi:hypothetical protein